MRSSIALIVAAMTVAACGDNGTNTTANSTAESTGETGTAGTTSGVPTTSGSTGTPSCTPGEIVCVGNDAQFVCEEDGVPGTEQPCAAGVCTPGVGCAECEMGDTRCMGDELQACGAMGMWETQTVCNAAQGLSCDEATGMCTGVCAPEELAKGGLTSAGCEFYAVTAINLLAQDLKTHFVVVVENPGDTDANITVSQTEDFMPVVDVVAAKTAKQITLPWAKPLYNAFKGELLADGAYKIESDAPVRVVQYNTVEISASVDSTMLWPRHTWETDYFAASYVSTPIMTNGMLTYYRGTWLMVGSEDMTKGTVTPRPGTKAKGGPGIGLDGGGNTLVSSGDVLQILSGDDGGDLTGAHLVMEKPVSVIGGHECGNVPIDVGYCDHMEDAMLPTSQLGTTYVLVPPVTNADENARRAQAVRIIATDGATDLMYDPPQANAPTTIPGTGEFVELEPSSETYVLTTSKPVLVAQYMVGYKYDDIESDPSMLTTLPVERYHTQHWVHALPDWMPLDIDIIAPTGATVMVGGMAVGTWTPVGGSNYSVGHVRFTDDPGLVEITSDQPAAVNVYSVQAGANKTSYWHGTGGLLKAP